MSHARLLPCPILRPRHIAAAALFGLLLVPALAAAQPPCTPANNNGTVHMPPANCPYVSPTDFHLIVAGLNPGDSLIIGVEHSRFVNVVDSVGGTLGGEKETFNSNLRLTMTGKGGLTGFNRIKVIPNAMCETHIGPRTPGNPVQSFDTQMYKLQGILPGGDPDFDLLRITAGGGFSMPSPGHTTLTLLENGNWNVDSFFDITYRIDFIGHPGTILGGHSGSTTGTIRMGTGVTVPTPPPPCTVVDDGSGTVSLPPNGCGYVSPADLHMMINGLPPGTTVTIAATHQDFFNVTHGPGGPLGGEVEQFQSNLSLRLKGTGSLAGYQSIKNMQAQCQTATGPRTPGNSHQEFDTEMMGLQGQITGDPDFDLLRITAGTGFSMPSPGHTTLSKNPPAGNWAVDSFFDISYRIDFIGHTPGPFAGRMGSTTGTIRMQAGQPTLLGVPGQGSSQSIQLSNHPNPFGVGTMLEYRLAAPAHVQLIVYDAAGKRVRQLISERQPLGPHAMMWDGLDDSGRSLRAGTYFVKLAIDGKIVGTKKAVLIK